jgi:heme-degrading monooxygenase HmoA
MFARVTTLQAAPDKVEAGTRYIQDSVIPMIQKQAGFRGYLGFADRKTGKGMAVTLWDTVEQLRASEGMAAQVRTQGGQILNVAQQPTVEVYEVPISSDQPSGSQPSGGQGASYARVTRAQMPPDNLGALLSWIDGTMLPVAEELGGFQGAYILVERQTGKAIAITVWESEEHLRANEAQMNQLRAEGAKTGGATEPPSSEAFEVVIIQA